MTYSRRKLVPLTSGHLVNDIFSAQTRAPHDVWPPGPCKTIDTQYCVKLSTKHNQTNCQRVNIAPFEEFNHQMCAPSINIFALFSHKIACYTPVLLYAISLISTTTISACDMSDRATFIHARGIPIHSCSYHHRELFAYLPAPSRAINTCYTSTCAITHIITNKTTQAKP